MYCIVNVPRHLYKIISHFFFSVYFALLFMCAKWLQSCPILLPYRLQPTRLHCLLDSPGKNTGEGCQALLQGIFQTQEWKPGLLCLLQWQLGSLPLAPPGKLYFALCLIKQTQSSNNCLQDKQVKVVYILDLSIYGCVFLFSPYL